MKPDFWFHLSAISNTQGERECERDAASTTSPAASAVPSHRRRSSAPTAAAGHLPPPQVVVCRPPTTVFLKLIEETFERDFQNVINSQGTGDGSSQDPNQPFSNPNELWVKTFKNKKGRIYGIGDEAVNMRESGYFSPTQRSGSGSKPSQQELNDLRGLVTNLRGELSSQAESYRLVMEKCKQLEESNRLLTQSNQQLRQQMMSIDQRLQAFFQIQQASGSGSQPPFTHPSQHNEEDGEAEEEEEEGEEEEEDLGD